MNTMTSFRNQTMEDPIAMLSALENRRMADRGYASTETRIGPVHSSNASTASGMAGSAWNDAGVFRGIPELDSPFAG